MKTKFEKNLQKRIDFLEAEKEDVETRLFKESDVRQYAQLHLAKCTFDLQIRELNWAKKQYQQGNSN